MISTNRAQIAVAKMHQGTRNRPTLILCLLLACIEHALCQSAEDVTSLLQDLYKKNISTRTRPVRDVATVTNVSVSFYLMSINSFEMVNHKLTTNGWLSVTWKDEYMVWNPDEHNGITTISTDPKRVWKPRLTVQNTMKDLKPIGQRVVTIEANSKGVMSWFPAEAFETSCRVDVTYFPFDTQQCQLVIFSWADDLTMVDVHHDKPVVHLDTFQCSGEWELMATSASRELKTVNGQTVPYVIFELTLRRRPSVLILTVLLPVLVLAAVNIYVFAIPLDSGERLSYAITVFMSYGVFMSFITDAMPTSSETTSILAIDISVLLILSALYVLLCVFTIRLFHRDDHRYPISTSVLKVVLLLNMIVCLRPSTTSRIGEEQDASVKENSSNDGTAKTDMMARGMYLKEPTEMTWKRVSHTLDAFFFRVFFLLVFATNITMCVALSVQYF